MWHYYKKIRESYQDIHSHLMEVFCNHCICKISINDFPNRDINLFQPLSGKMLDGKMTVLWERDYLPVLSKVLIERTILKLMGCVLFSSAVR